MTVPRSTLRLQLHRGFTFDDAHAHVDYFAALGVSHLYLSPITASVPGSLHGYDTIDYARVNPELGGEAALLRLAVLLHRSHETERMPSLHLRADGERLTLTLDKRWLQARPLLRADLDGEPEDMLGLGVQLRIDVG